MLRSVRLISGHRRNLADGAPREGYRLAGLIFWVKCQDLQPHQRWVELGPGAPFIELISVERSQANAYGSGRGSSRVSDAIACTSRPALPAMHPRTYDPVGLCVAASASR